MINIPFNIILNDIAKKLKKHGETCGSNYFTID